MLSRLRSLLPFRTSPPDTPCTDSSRMPFVTGSEPWLRPYLLAALSHPPHPPTLNAHYLQAITPVSPRRELTVYDGRHVIPAVLSQAAASALDADDDDTGVTTRNLLGHVLAPVAVVVVPDMTTTPPTATLLIQHLRVFPDRVHQRPVGTVPLVYTDPDVCDALRAIVGRQLASYATATVLERADRAMDTHHHISPAADALFEKLLDDPSIPPADLVSRSDNFVLEPRRGTVVGGGYEIEPLAVILEHPTPDDTQDSPKHAELAASADGSQGNQHDKEWDLTFTQDPAHGGDTTHIDVEALPQTQHFAMDDADDNDDAEDAEDEDNNESHDEEAAHDNGKVNDKEGHRDDHGDDDQKDKDKKRETSLPSPTKSSAERGTRSTADRAGQNASQEAPKQISPTAKNENPSNPVEIPNEGKARSPGERGESPSNIAGSSTKPKIVNAAAEQTKKSMKESVVGPVSTLEEGLTDAASSSISAKHPANVSMSETRPSPKGSGSSTKVQSPEKNKQVVNPPNTDAKAATRQAKKVSTGSTDEARARQEETLTVPSSTTDQKPESTSPVPSVMKTPPRRPRREKDVALSPESNIEKSKTSSPLRRSPRRPLQKDIAADDRALLSSNRTRQKLAPRSESRKVSTGSVETAVQEDTRSPDKEVPKPLIGEGQRSARMKSAEADRVGTGSSLEDKDSRGSLPGVTHPESDTIAEDTKIDKEIKASGIKRGTAKKPETEKNAKKRPRHDDEAPDSEPFMDKLRAEIEEMRRFRDRRDKNPAGFTWNPDVFLPSDQPHQDSRRKSLSFPPPGPSAGRIVDVPESAPM